MFALSCFVFAVASSGPVKTVIPIEYRRPSSILNLIQPNGKRLIEEAVVTPDDAGGDLIVLGSKADAAEIRNVVAMFDVPRQRAQLAIDIEAPTDRLRYKQTIETYGGETWTSEQSELGLKLSITLEPQVGRTVTVKVRMEYRKHKSESTFRLPLGGSAPLSFGKAVVDDPVPGVHLQEQTPIVTFKYLGLRGD